MSAWVAACSSFNRPMPAAKPPPSLQMFNLAKAFARAVTCHQQGKLPEAERFCLQILQALPDHFDAKHLLALIRHQQGRSAEGADLIMQALKINPRVPGALSNLGLMLQALNR